MDFLQPGAIRKSTRADGFDRLRQGDGIVVHKFAQHIWDIFHRVAENDMGERVGESLGESLGECPFCLNSLFPIA